MRLHLLTTSLLLSSVAGGFAPSWRPPIKPHAGQQERPTQAVSPPVWSLRQLPTTLLSYGGAGSIALGSAALVTQLATPAAGAALLAYTVLPGAILLAELLLFGGGKRVAELMGGKPADQSLVAAVAEVAGRAGHPVPAHVYEIPTDEMNAFAAGLRRSDQTVAVTRGLRQALTDRELKAVIAHEMGHFRSSHVAQNMHTAVAVAGLGGVYQYGRMLLREPRQKSKSKKKDEGSTVALGIALMVAGSAARVAGEFLRCFASRTNEFEADAVAAELYGAEAIISALRTIDGPRGKRAARGDDSPLGARGGAFSHAYISSPSAKPADEHPASRASNEHGGWSRIGAAWAAVKRGLRTHPTLDERVAAIRAANK